MEKHEYTTHNYGAVNQAINNEVDKQASLNYLVLSKARLHTVVAMSILGIALAVLILLGILIYKLWSFKFSETEIQPAPAESSAQIVVVDPDSQQLTQDGLEQLKQDTNIEPLINTHFHVFKDTITDTGEKVVTGLEYDPTDLEVPKTQYCYLEGDGLGGIRLAEVDKEFVITLIDDDPYLNSLVGEYCLFVVPSSAPLN